MANYQLLGANKSTHLLLVSLLQKSISHTVLSVRITSKMRNFQTSASILHALISTADGATTENYKFLVSWRAKMMS